MSIPSSTDPFDDFMADPEDAADGAWPVAEPGKNLPAEAAAIPAVLKQDEATLEPLTPEHAPTRARLRNGSGIRLVALVLAAGLGLVGWRAYALDVERDALERKLEQEVNAHRQALLLARNAEAELASTRRAFLDEQAKTQEQRAADAQRAEEAARVQNLAAADCVTPRSILRAAGL